MIFIYSNDYFTLNSAASCRGKLYIAPVKQSIIIHDGNNNSDSEAEPSTYSSEDTDTDGSEIIHNNHIQRTNNQRTDGYHRVTQRSNNQRIRTNSNETSNNTQQTTTYEMNQNSEHQIGLNSNLNLRNNQGK